MFKSICLLAVLLAAVAEAAAAEYLVYVGTYTGVGSEGIYTFRFDPATGETSAVSLAAATDNPSFLAVDPNGRFLYAVNELDDVPRRADRRGQRVRDRSGVRHAGAPAAGFLARRRSGAPVPGQDGAGYLLVANYNGGNVAVFPIGPDGRLGPHSAFVQDVGSSVNPERQAGPHAHFIQVTNDNRFAMVADLGLDQLLVHRFDAATGSLTPGSPPFVRMDPGAGPRHAAFAPSGKFVYVVNELASTVTVFAYDPGPGVLRSVQTIPTLPGDFAGANTAAEIEVDAKGRFLYVSNRGDDSIAVFGIDPDDGRLTSLEWVPSGGRTPRHFAIDPTGRWLFAANQGSNTINLFRIDPTSGRLTPTDRSLTVVSPVCVRFVSSE